MVSSDRDDMILEVLSDAAYASGDWARANCPFCLDVTGKEDKKKSFGVHRDGGYHCFRCYTSGHLGAVPEWANFSSRKIIEDDEPEGMDFLHEAGGFIPLWRDPGRTALTLETARSYLCSRAIGPDVWEEAHVGAVIQGKYRGRIIVPIFNVVGDDWVGFASRVWVPKAPLAHLYPPKMSRKLFYEQHLVEEESDELVIIVEGVLDALPYFGHAVACLGKPTHWHQQEFKKMRRPFVFCLDGDAHLEAKMLAVRLRYFGCRCASVKLPPGCDPNGLAVEHGPNWLLDRAEAALFDAEF